MANQGSIIVPSGIEAVHSFDLWGTLVIQNILGPRVLEAYKALMQGQEDPDIVRRNIAHYNDVLQGDSVALENKKVYVDAVEDPLWLAYTTRQIDVDFTGTFYQDAIDVMADIVGVGEELCILTTSNSPWVQQAVTSLHPDVGRRIRNVYSGNKTLSQTYEATAADIATNHGQMVSHTEDQLKGLTGILQSDLRNCVKLVYVERADHVTQEHVSAKGIDHYVRDLKNVTYAQMAEVRQ
jgi:FMN phosphatase YigB (HAD superfamily)